MVAEILFNHGALRHRNEEASLRDNHMVNTRSIRRASHDAREDRGDTWINTHTRAERFATAGSTRSRVRDRSFGDRCRKITPGWPRASVLGMATTVLVGEESGVRELGKTPW
jgi:hypothetical protein